MIAHRSYSASYRHNYAHRIFRCAKKENPNLGKPELFEQKRLRNLTAREIDVNSLRSRGEASLNAGS